MAYVQIDATQPGDAFPRIHEGRYEVDPEQQRITPPPQAVIDAVRRAGVKLARVGLGCWLPGQDPDGQGLYDREWFSGTTLADTAREENYRWTHLDRVVDACVALDCELLLSIDAMPASLADARPHAELPSWVPAGLRSYAFPDGVRNAPPKDPAVFAAAALRVVRHAEARGGRIRYVELWNEPDLPLFWCGTPGEYIDMYRAFAPVMSEAGYRVGGSSLAWVTPESEPCYLHQFVQTCVAEGLPLDFFSWHTYRRTVDGVLENARKAREALDEAGLRNTESIPDEWGYALGPDDNTFWGTVGNAAFIAACLMRLPDFGVSAQTHPLIVDPADVPVRLLGLTRSNGEPNPIWHTISAFEDFQQTPRRLPVDGDAFVLAGVDNEGSRLQIICANPGVDVSVSHSLQIKGARGNATMRRLTQQVFDANLGWGSEQRMRIDGADLVVEMEPGSLAVLDVQLDRPRPLTR